MTMSFVYKFKACNHASRHAIRAALVAAVMMAGAGFAPAVAQYNDQDDGGYDDSDQSYPRDQNNDRDQGYDDGQADDSAQVYDDGSDPNLSSSDDGSYPSDQRGYAADDDEDGYEDGQDAPDVAYFYDELEDQGSWVYHPQYGQVFRPRGIDADWRPYTRGTWANTEDHGWYWVSDESFGWATYHYGRWHLDDRYGWVWVPGTRWAPAWVAWRSSDDHIGWAPLPPESRWDHGHGLRVDEAIYDSPRYTSYWSFVEPRYVTAPRLYTHFAPRSRVTLFFTTTRPQTNYVFINRRIVNRGVSVAHIERVTRSRISTVRVTASDNRAYRSARRDNNSINVFRPKLTRAAVRPRPPGRPALDRGQWRDVDKRPVRQDRTVRPRPRDKAGLPNNARNPAVPYSGPAGLPRATTGPLKVPNRDLRQTRPDVDRERGRDRDLDRNPASQPGPRGQFRSKADRPDPPSIRSRNNDRDDGRARKPERAVAPNRGLPQQGNTTGPAGIARGTPSYGATGRELSPEAAKAARKKRQDKKKDED